MQGGRAEEGRDGAAERERGGWEGREKLGQRSKNAGEDKKGRPTGTRKKEPEAVQASLHARHSPPPSAQMAPPVLNKAKVARAH